MITRQALGPMLFSMADILRERVEDYKAYILSLLFFKRLSDNHQWEIDNAIKQFKIENNREPSPRELVVLTKKKHVFSIPEGCFWEDIRLCPIDKKNEKLESALSAIAKKILTITESTF